MYVGASPTVPMLLFADSRRFSSSEEGLSRCVFCDRDLVLLPDDRRRGSCFDCLELAVPVPTLCPSCGSMIAGDARALGCPECRWYPGRA
jgi:hypothetical protein